MGSVVEPGQIKWKMVGNLPREELGVSGSSEAPPGKFSALAIPLFCIAESIPLSKPHSQRLLCK